MKKVTQTLPKPQVKIITEALSMLENTLKSLKDYGETDDNIDYKIFDILTLKALLNSSEVDLQIPFETYENFTAINGIDFPIYSK